MLEPIREYFVKDGYVLHTWEYDPAWNKRRKTVYEVLRVMDGVPLFETEHIDRLMQSASGSGFKNVSPEKARTSIRKLIKANSDENGNVLCCVVANKEAHHILSWYINHKYPSAENYDQGILVHTLKAVRKNPAAKVWNAELRVKADYIMKSTGAWEVLLIDRKKNVTEGSRSNVFFIRGNSLFTPPESKVLKGITRQKVIRLCEQLGIPVIEEEIGLRDIPFFEAAFITGTSPGIIAVNTIDSHRFNVSHGFIKKLMAAYNSLVREATIRN